MEFLVIISWNCKEKLNYAKVLECTRVLWYQGIYRYYFTLFVLECTSTWDLKSRYPGTGTRVQACPRSAEFRFNFVFGCSSLLQPAHVPVTEHDTWRTNHDPSQITRRARCSALETFAVQWCELCKRAARAASDPLHTDVCSQVMCVNASKLVFRTMQAPRAVSRFSIELVKLFKAQPHMWKRWYFTY